MRTHLFIAVSLLLFIRTSNAADGKAADNNLIKRAEKISDIRADGSPSFRMEATFRITPRSQGKSVEGSYTEIWVSKTKWRRETQTGSFRRVEIRVPSKKWLLDSGTDRPDAAMYGPLAFLFLRRDPVVQNVSERDVDAVKAICLESKLDLWSKNIDCVDPTSGVLLLDESITTPDDLPPVRHSCIYSEYEPFADHSFPRRIHCLNDPGEDVDLTVLKLKAEPSSEDSLFIYPHGATESRACEGGVTPPRAIYAPDPSYPPHHSENSMSVLLWTTVGDDGKPNDLKVAGSGGDDFDRAALEAAKRWRFQPSKCDGQPIPTKINIRINFRRF